MRESSRGQQREKRGQHLVPPRTDPSTHFPESTTWEGPLSAVNFSFPRGKGLGLRWALILLPSLSRRGPSFLHTHSGPRLLGRGAWSCRRRESSRGLSGWTRRAPLCLRKHRPWPRLRPPPREPPAAPSRRWSRGPLTPSPPCFLQFRPSPPVHRVSHTHTSSSFFSPIPGSPDPALPHFGPFTASPLIFQAPRLSQPPLGSPGKPRLPSARPRPRPLGPAPPGWLSSWPGAPSGVCACSLLPTAKSSKGTF